VSDNLYIKSTETTPEINFNLDTGCFSVTGKSIPRDKDCFWKDIKEWLAVNIKNCKSKSVKIKFNVEYFNTSSSRFILDIIFIFNSFYKDDLNVKIIWEYISGDEDMLEAGKEYENMTNIPFEFIELT
jgi:hypothetical protein